MKEFAEKLLEAAKKAGAEMADVYCVKKEGVSASVYEGQVDEFARMSSQGAGLRVFMDGRVGYAYSEAFADAKAVAAAAVANAQVAAQGDSGGIYEGNGDYEKLSQIEMDLSDRDTVNYAKELYNCVMDEGASTVQSCAAETSATRVLLANSSGLMLRHVRNIASIMAEPVVKKGDWADSNWAFDARNSLDELRLADTAKLAVQKAMEFYGAGRINSGRYPVVIKSQAACDLIETFAGVFSAERAQKGLSLLSNREGQKIANELVTIYDDPVNKSLPFNTPFDGEGVPCSKKAVVQEGVLTTLLHNLRTAQKAGAQPTGNARRGYSTTVDVGPTNFYINPGQTAFDRLLGMAGNGVLICEVSGLHAGANPVSGDFSLLAKGHEIKNGTIERPLEQIVLSGNLFEMLKNVAAVGTDIFYGYPSSGSFGSPSLFVGTMDVAGG